MRKGWWIGLCLILLFSNIYFGSKYSSTGKAPYLKNIQVHGLEPLMLPNKNSLLTLIIYFSHRSGNKYMEESFYWNKLYDEIPINDLYIIGIIPGNEEIGNLKDKWGIKFPVGFDDRLILARTVLISFTPYRIILDRDGKIFYMAPSSSNLESHKEFYYHIIELIKKRKEAEYQKGWPK